MWEEGCKIKFQSITTIMQEKVLYSEYQPLMDSSNDAIFAYEALMRTTPRMNPLEVLEIARKNGIQYELDTFCIINAIKEFPCYYLKSHLLFINILPTTIVHHEFESFIRRLLFKYPEIQSYIVFEINEKVIEENIWEQTIFINRISFLKSVGFKIAFDDLPVTKSSFRMMEMISPDFVKLDHTKSKGLSNSIEKQSLISLFLEYTHKNIKLVLEGIETKDDFFTAKQLGVHLLQGYYISKPMRL